MSNKELTMINEYKIISKIYDGLVNTVYLVEFEGHEYALKLLQKANADNLVRFRRESATLARLNHENLIKVIGIGDFEDTCYIVTEYLIGKTLEQKIESEKMTDIESVEVMKLASKALAELHRNNLVHRDIKPANIFITSDNKVKLMDLGLVVDIEQVKSETALVGTPLFCSPEQSLVLNRPVDFRSDIYSLGATLFTLLTGQPPFQGTFTEILQQHASLKAPDVHSLNADVLKSIASIVAKTLLKDPDDRYQTIESLIYDFNRLPEIDDLLQKGQEPSLGKFDNNKTRSTKVAFVEREEENKKLREFWNSASGNPGLTIVSGSSGLGKSRLCLEFLDKVRTPGTLILNSKCQLHDRNLPFGPIREAFDSLIEEITSLSGTQRAEQIQKVQRAGQSLEAELISFSRSFKKVFTEAVVQKDRSSEVDSDREIFFSKITDFILKLTEEWQSVVFFIDDLQWLDISSLQLLKKSFEAAAGKSLIVLGTARNDADNESYIQVIEEELASVYKGRLELEMLSKEQMAKLIAQYLGTQRVSEKITDSITFKSNGNPLIAIEYLRAGIEQGFLKFQSSDWILNTETLEKLNFSENIYDIILQRVEKSPADIKEFLHAAALFGTTFNSIDIAKALGKQSEDSERILSFALNQGLVEKINSVKWKMIHDKITESLMQSMSPEKLKMTSQQLAEYFSKKNEKTAEEIFATSRLFTNCIEAENTEMAIQAYIAAGDVAIETYAFREAYHFYKLAYNLIRNDEKSPAQKLKVCLNLTICATYAEDPNLAGECADVYISLAESKAALIHAQAQKIWMLNHQGDFVESWQVFKKVCVSLKDPFPLHFQWKLIQLVYLWILTIVYEFIPVKKSPESFFKIKDIDFSKIANTYRDSFMCAEATGRAIDQCLIALKILHMGQATGRLRERALGYAFVGYIYGAFGIRALFEAYIRLSEQCYTKLGNPEITASCETRRLLGGTYCGSISDYSKEYREKFNFFKKYLSPSELIRLTMFNGYLMGLRGYYNEAIQGFQQLLNSKNNKTVLVSKTAEVQILSQLWFNLAAIGRTQESQKIKSIALSKNNILRFNPNAFKAAIMAEINYNRVSKSLDNKYDEIVTYFTKRAAPGYMEIYMNVIMSMTSYNYLLKYENAQSEAEKFSRRHDVKQILNRLYLRLYSPMFRAEYFCAEGGFFRLEGDLARALASLETAERLASQSANVIVLFDIQIERARIYREQGQIELVKLCVSAASSLAAEHSWKIASERLFKEFDRFVEAPDFAVRKDNFAGNTIQMSTTLHSTLVTPSRSQTYQASSTSRILDGQVGATVNSTVMANENHGIAPESMRIMDAMLNVSNAFVTSIEPSEQAKAVLNELVKLFAAERGFIFHVDTNTGELKVLAGKNNIGQDVNDLKGYSTTVVNKVFKDQVPLIIAGTDEAEALGSESAVLYNLRSMMATPLTIKGRMLGLVYLDSSLTKGLFTKKDIGLFSTLASHISVAFELTRIAQVELEKANLRRELDIQSAISAESKKVEILVDNMQQALFSVSSDGSIVEPVSRYSERVFGKNITGQNIYNVLFKPLEKDKQKMDLVQSVFNSVYGEDDLQWDLMENHLPRKLYFDETQEAASKKVLKVQSSPIWGTDQNLERILFVVEDITSLEALEIQLGEQKAQAALLSDIVESPKEELGEFFGRSREMLQKCNLLARRGSEDSLPEIMRDLHTLKGNARLFKLQRMSQQIHDSETEIIQMKESNAEVTAVYELILKESEKISMVMDHYEKLFTRLYPESKGLESSAGISGQAIEDLRNVIESLPANIGVAERKKLKLSAQRLSYKSLAANVNRFQTMVEDISSQLGKKVHFQVEGDALISADQAHYFKEILLHLLRNSLDHGLESPEERLQNGKTPEGILKVRLEDHVDSLVISISDDGRGIDGDKIAKQAVQKGLIDASKLSQLSKEEKEGLIFLPGFSSKDQATDISGRGIGMDVVKQTVEKLGGQIHLETRPQFGSTFKIAINNSMLKSA